MGVLEGEDIPERWAHPVGSIHLTQLHSSHNQPGYDFPRAFDDGVLRGIHIQSTHPTKFLDLLHAHEALDAERTKGPIVARGGNHKWGVDGVGVHARLIIVVHADEGPVGDNACNADGAVIQGSGDEVLDGGGIEELNVGKLEDLGQ